MLLQMSPGSICFLLFSSVSVCCLVPVHCYANGKVTEVCDSMEPHHRGSGETTPSPYCLDVNTTTFSPLDSIQVILSGTTYFEGFLLQARDAANQSSVSAVGTFTLTNPKRTQLLTCNEHQGSAVSHTNDHKQTEVVVIWNAPADAPAQRDCSRPLQQVLGETAWTNHPSAWCYSSPTSASHYTTFGTNNHTTLHPAWTFYV